METSPVGVLGQGGAARCRCEEALKGQEENSVTVCIDAEKVLAEL